MLSKLASTTDGTVKTQANWHGNWLWELRKTVTHTISGCLVLLLMAGLCFDVCTYCQQAFCTLTFMLMIMVLSVEHQLVTKSCTRRLVLTLYFQGLVACCSNHTEAANPPVLLFCPSMGRAVSSGFCQSSGPITYFREV